MAKRWLMALVGLMLFPVLAWAHGAEPDSTKSAASKLYLAVKIEHQWAKQEQTECGKCGKAFTTDEDVSQLKLGLYGSYPLVPYSVYLMGRASYLVDTEQPEYAIGLEIKLY